MEDIHMFEIKTTNGKMLRATIEHSTNGLFIGLLAPVNVNCPFTSDETYFQATHPCKSEAVFNILISKVTTFLVDKDVLDTISSIDNSLPLFVSISDQKKITGEDVVIMIDGIPQ